MFKGQKLWRIWALTFAVAAMLCVVPRAGAQDNDQDPPSRVARLSYVNGSVSFQPAGADQDDWGDAEQNRPITTGDKLWADQDGRAEVRLGGSAMRIAPNTAFTFLNLTDTTTQISVSEGELNLHLRRLGEDQSFEVDTPNLAFTALRPGDYTIIVNENGDTTWITVRSGDGEITGGGQAFNLNAGQIGTFAGTDSLEGDVDQASGPDEFEGWAMQRNAAFDRPPVQYVSDQMVGYEDLQDNGDWRDDPQYGHVWAPRVEAGWAPYRNGHWAWVAPWGWTWVDDAPWGFAPFHYGRWVSVRGSWCWTPGPVVVGVRPVYAPALVAWVGSPGVGVAIGGGAVGVAWFPLGPREVYVPPYHVSERYVTNVNVTNTVVERTTVVNVYKTTVINKTVVNTTYVNRSATVVTSRDTFTSARSVRANVVKVDERTISRAQVGTYNGAGVAPVKASLVVRNAPGRAAVRVPPARVESRAVVAKKAPPPPPPSFTVQQKAIAANGGKPLAPAKVAQLRPAAAPKAAAPVRVAPAAKVAPVTALKKPAAPLAKPPAPGAKAPAGAPAAAPAANKPAAAAPPTKPANAPAANAPAANKPGNAPAANKPGAAAPPANANKPGEAPANKPPAAANPPANANRPPANAPGNKPPATATRPTPGSKPAVNAPANKPEEAPANRPPANAPANRPPNANAPGNKPPAANAPANRPGATPVERPGNEPGNRPNRPNQPAAKPGENQPGNRPPAANRPGAAPAEKPANRSPADNRPPAANRPADNRPPAANKPAEKPAPKPAAKPGQPNKPETPQEKAAREKREKENKPQ